MAVPVKYCASCAKNEPHTCSMTGDVVQRGAEISACENYRYALYRTIPGANERRTLVVIGHNPSTANATDDDPTIRRVMGFARRFDYGFLAMLNLFAYRATIPEDVPQDWRAIGPDNERHLCTWFAIASKVICAWGGMQHECKPQAIDAVVSIARQTNQKLFCLGTTKDGSPRHPLYLKADTAPTLWIPHAGALRDGWKVTERHGEPLWYFNNGAVWVAQYEGPRDVPYWIPYRATEKSGIRGAAFWTANNVRICDDCQTLEVAMIAAEKATNGR